MVVFTAEDAVALAGVATAGEVTRLDLAGRDIHEVLNIAHNSLPSLSPLRLLPSLRALLANNNRLSTSPFPLLNSKLHTLVLSHNGISAGVGDALKEQSELVKLSLSYNEIGEVGEKELEECKGSLVELRLAHNRMEFLPPSLSLLSRLRILDLGHNRISSLAPASARVLAALARPSGELRNLNLAGNGCAGAEDHREKVLAIVPGLEVLDGHRIIGGQDGKRKARDTDKDKEHARRKDRDEVQEEEEKVKDTVKAKGKGNDKDEARGNGRPDPARKRKKPVREDRTTHDNEGDVDDDALDEEQFLSTAAAQPAPSHHNNNNNKPTTKKARAASGVVAVKTVTNAKAHNKERDGGLRGKGAVAELVRALSAMREGEVGAGGRSAWDDEEEEGEGKEEEGEREKRQGKGEKVRVHKRSREW
eukprot:jgi/Chlat1/6689/Chrsp49S06135